MGLQQTDRYSPDQQCQYFVGDGKSEQHAIQFSLDNVHLYERNILRLLFSVTELFLTSWLRKLLTMCSITKTDVVATVCVNNMAIFFVCPLCLTLVINTGVFLSGVSGDVPTLVWFIPTSSDWFARAEEGSDRSHSSNSVWQSSYIINATGLCN